jgi:hypothetical protein
MAITDTEDGCQGTIPLDSSTGDHERSWRSMLNNWVQGWREMMDVYPLELITSASYSHDERSTVIDDYPVDFSQVESDDSSFHMVSDMT